MSKRHRNAPGPGHFKVQGHRIEDSDAAGTSKQALDREAARLERRRPKKAAAPKRRRAAAAPKVEVVVPKVLERAHDREFAKMNERRAPKRVEPAARDARDGQPSYLSEAARGVIRRAARVVLAPLSLARAVVDRIRDRD